MKAVRTAQKHSAGIDFFRLAAACMVVAIHTAPLSSVSEDADYLLTYCLGRVAVPFFLMTSGYFVLAPYIWNKAHKKQSLRRFLIKNALLYFAVSLLYLPISLYSGNLPKHAGEL